MQANINVKYMDAASEEILEIERLLGHLSLEIESVEKQLTYQSEFAHHAAQLSKLNSSIIDSKRKLKSLTQGLSTVSMLYCRTEISIEDFFEAALPKYISLPVSSINLAKLNNKVNAILYGR